MRIIDSHVHIETGKAGELLTEARKYGYDRICALGIPCCDNIFENLECMRLKDLAPGYAYVYGGLVYSKKVEPSAKNHEKQLRLLIDSGFDGWKILESKPSIYKRLRLPLDGEVFERAFALAEEAGFPITCHAGDPASFWSADTAPEFAVRNKWLCTGEGVPALKEIYRQVETVLERHPRLHLTLAHMYFTTDDPAHAERLLDKYENLRCDLTPGSEMYADFMAKPGYWYDFFIRRQDRLLYGSDMTGDPDDIVFGSQREIVRLATNTLTTDEEFEVKWIRGKGLKLPDEVLTKLFHENFIRIAGEVPRTVNAAALDEYKAFIHRFE